MDTSNPIPLFKKARMKKQILPPKQQNHRQVCFSVPHGDASCSAGNCKEVCFQWGIYLLCFIVAVVVSFLFQLLCVFFFLQGKNSLNKQKFLCITARRKTKMVISQNFRTFLCKYLEASKKCEQKLQKLVWLAASPLLSSQTS